ncbi:MAG TPA: hypothetical protein VGI50_02065 [Solirubrobacteraceae bacterium]
MARQPIGHVIERPWSDGQTVSYGARVRAYGRYEKVTFGTNKQGWNRTPGGARDRTDRPADRAGNVGSTPA